MFLRTTQFLRATLASATLILAAGCGHRTIDSNETSGQGGFVLPSVVSIVLADSNDELVDGAMVIEIYENEAAHYAPVVLFLGGTSEGSVWQLSGGLDIPALTSGVDLTLDVVELPFENRTANLSVSIQGDDAPPSESATAVKVTLLLDTSAPNVRGSVSATPTSMSATFSGTFWLWCHYAGPSGESMLDEAFETPFCQQFSMWKPVGQEGPPTVGY